MHFSGDSPTGLQGCERTESDWRTLFDDLVSALPEDDRGKAYAEANCHDWPSAFLNLKPQGFDAMNNEERRNLAQYTALWKSLNAHLSEFAKSRGWWVHELKRTPEEHLAWWEGKGKVLTDITHGGEVK